MADRNPQPVVVHSHRHQSSNLQPSMLRSGGKYYPMDQYSGNQRSYDPYAPGVGGGQRRSDAAREIAKFDYAFNDAKRGW